MTAKKKVYLVLALLLVAIMSFGIMFTFSAKEAGAIAIYPFRRYGTNENTKMERYYFDHWRTGQDQRVADEPTNGGTWSFGYGKAVDATNTYSFTQATRNLTEDANDLGRYTTGTAHQLCWTYSVSTGLAADETGDQSMFIWSAEAKGTVKFTGMFSRRKSGTNIATLSESYTNAPNGMGNASPYGANDPYVAGVNTADTANTWTDGEFYTTAMFKRVASTGEIICVNYQSHNTEYVWYVNPDMTYDVEAGDMFIFGLLCTNIGTLGSAYETGTLALFSSQFTASTVAPDEGGGTVTPPPEQPEDSTLPERLDDIVSTTGYTKIAHYKFDDANDLGKDSLGNYNLTNMGLALDSEKGGLSLNGNAGAEKFMFSPKGAKDGSDFSDAIKGNFSFSFRAYAQAGLSSDTEDHVIFSAGTAEQGIEVLWQDCDFVIRANGQDYRIDNAKTKDEYGNETLIKMLDETPAWYRYTVSYDESDEDNIILQIRVDREVETEDGPMYGNMTVITKKKLKEKITFGGSVDYTFAIGARSTFGTYNLGFSQGYTNNNEPFSPIISDLRIYSGVVTDEEIIDIWKFDEGGPIEDGGRWYDRSAVYKLEVDNDYTKGSISGAQETTYGNTTPLTIKIEVNPGYLIKSIAWNGVQVAFDNNESFTFTRQITRDSTLKVEYDRIMFSVDVFSAGVKDTNLSGEYEYNSKLSIQITPNKGCKIDKIIWNGEEVKGVSKTGYLFESTILKDDNKLEITFVKDKATITVRVDGKLDSSLTKNAFANDIYAMSITPAPGRYIKSIKWGTEAIMLSEEDSKGFTLTHVIDKSVMVYVVFGDLEELTVYNSANSSSAAPTENGGNGGNAVAEDNSCSSSVMPMYALSALLVVATAVVIVKKTKKSK